MRDFSESMHSDGNGVKWLEIKVDGHEYKMNFPTWADAQFELARWRREFSTEESS